MRIKIQLIIVFIFACIYSFAQTLTPTVIASAGNFASSGGYSLSYTVGEPMVQTFSTSLNFLTQGFQQPESNQGAFVQEINGNNSSVTLRPNPTTGEISVTLTSTEPQPCKATIYDLLGRQVLQPTSSFQSGPIQQFHIDLGTLSPGMYFLGISNSSGNALQTVKVEKID